MVGTLDDIHIMLYDNNSMSTLQQFVEGMKEFLDIMKMETCCGLIEDKHRWSLILHTYIICQLYTLVLTT